MIWRVMMRQVETPPDQAAVAEDASYFFRVRIRGDVKVLGLVVEQQVAHGSLQLREARFGILHLLGQLAHFSLERLGFRVITRLHQLEHFLSIVYTSNSVSGNR